MCKSFANDILQPLPLEGFAAYRNECLKHYPSAIKAHRLLFLHERWARIFQSAENHNLRREISERCVYKFYVHRSRDVSKCTFVAITETNHCDDYLVYPFTLEESTTELRECFYQTKRIKWNLGPLVAHLHTNHMDIFETFRIERQFCAVIPNPQPFICVWLPKEKVPAMDFELPSNVYVAQITPDYAKVITDNWEDRTTTAENYIRSVIRLNQNYFYGLFDKETNDLLCYAGMSENLCIGYLHTMEAARGRGLGKIIVQYQCQEFVKRENLDLFAFVHVDNVFSQKLFKSLGFTECARTKYTKLVTVDEN